MTWLAEAVAALPWLATLLELAATRSRLVTAMSPKIRTVTATSASTRVKPAWPRRAFGSRVLVIMRVSSGLGQHAAARGQANRPPQERALLEQGDHEPPVIVASGAMKSDPPSRSQRVPSAVAQGAATAGAQAPPAAGLQ